MIRNQDDWLTGQIDTIIKLLAQLYFQDSKAITCLDESEKRNLYQEAMALMEKQAYQQLNQLLLEKAETRSKETLKLADVYKRHVCRILTYISLLTPAFSLPCSPPLLTVWLLRTWNAPLPLDFHQIRSFGIMLSPSTFSAQGHSTSELLRTLSRMAASEPVSYTHLDVYKRQSSSAGMPANLKLIKEMIERPASVKLLIASAMMAMLPLITPQSSLNKNNTILIKIPISEVTLPYASRTFGSFIFS